MQPEANTFLRPFDTYATLLSVVASIKNRKTNIGNTVRRPPPAPQSPWFLLVKPEVDNLVKALRYLGDVIVACRLNKKIKTYRI